MYNDVSKGSACVKVQVTKSASDKLSKPRYSSTKNTRSDLTIIKINKNNLCKALSTGLGTVGGLNVSYQHC